MKRLAFAIFAVLALASPGEPYQCETDLQCELAHGEPI